MKSPALLTLTVLTALLALLPVTACGENSAPSFAPIRGEHKVEARGDRLFLDSAPFFVRAVGYEAGCRPGRLPWKRPYEPALLAGDFVNVRQAGFNTLRTWSPMTDSELVLAADHGLWVIQGIWTDWNRYWTDAAYHREAIASVRSEVARSSRHPNILFYLVMNEPSAEMLLAVGLDTAVAGLRELADAVHAADSTALVSMSNCPLADFLDTGVWDIVCSNNYPYGPAHVHDAMGYRGYTEWIARRSLPRPYMTTEFGLSVSPDGPGKWGYGGNTLTEQAEGVSSMYRDIAQSGAAGACPFMWIDGWWKSPGGGEGNESTHDPHPEEWFGFYDVTPANEKGTARPVVAALAEVNRLIVLAPGAGDLVTRKTGVRVVAPGGEPVACFRGAAPVKLSFLGHDEWEGVIESRAEGEAVIEITANGVTRSVPVLVSDRGGAPGEIRIVPDRTEVLEGETVGVTVTVTDRVRAATAGCSIALVECNYRAMSTRTFELLADSAGQARLVLRTCGRQGVLGIAAGATVGMMTSPRRVADLAFVTVKPNPDLGLLLKGRKPRPIVAFDFRTAEEARAAFSTVYKGAAEITIGARNGQLLLDYLPEPSGAWIYMARQLGGLIDLTGATYLSYEIAGGTSGAQVKVQLVDEDGERWFQGAATPPGSRSQLLVWDLQGDLERDPYDQVTDGNKRFDRDKVAGVAIVLTGTGASPGIRLARLTVWR